MERLTEDSSETDLLNKQAVLQNQSKKYHQLNLKLMLVLIKKLSQLEHHLEVYKSQEPRGFQHHR